MLDGLLPSGSVHSAAKRQGRRGEIQGVPLLFRHRGFVGRAEGTCCFRARLSDVGTILTLGLSVLIGINIINMQNEIQRAKEFSVRGSGRSLK